MGIHHILFLVKSWTYSANKNLQPAHLTLVYLSLAQLGLGKQED